MTAIDSSESVQNGFNIGPHRITGRAILAPMAGLTDQPFRNLCRSFGAALAVSEMNTSDVRLWNSAKSQTRLHFANENGLKVLQIAGSDPHQLADAAQAACEFGPDIIDINMGCPAKKVCRKLAGSALLKDEALVERILHAVTQATTLPVTLKTRTGWDKDHRNGVRIAQIAQEAGIKALTVHGRTRACMFKGQAEYATIRAIKSAVDIPVIANGDIDSVQVAHRVLNITQADAVMIGRGALGRPWIFSQLNHSLDPENFFAQDRLLENNLGLRRATILAHLKALHRLYGENKGVRVARKHLTWYCKYISGAERFRNEVVRSESAAEQLRITNKFFDQIHNLTGENKPLGLITTRNFSDLNDNAQFHTQNQQKKSPKKVRANGPEPQPTA